MIFYKWFFVPYPNQRTRLVTSQNKIQITHLKKHKVETHWWSAKRYTSNMYYGIWVGRNICSFVNMMRGESCSENKYSPLFIPLPCSLLVASPRLSVAPAEGFIWPKNGQVTKNWNKSLVEGLDSGTITLIQRLVMMQTIFCSISVILLYHQRQIKILHTLLNNVCS